MKNRTLKASVLISALLTAATGNAFADRYQGNAFADRHQDYAKVIEVEPIYETVRTSYPQERCWEERRSGWQRSSHSDGATVAGAIIGGVIGHQLGRGHGKDAATVAGAVLGGALAHDSARYDRHSVQHSPRKRCKVVESYKERREITGYDVTYRYRGQEYYTRTLHHPGERIAVRIDVKPERGRHHWR